MLFNNNLPYSPLVQKPRNFQGNWLTNTKLAITGSKTTGESNWWGKFANYAIPAAAGIVTGYFTGGAGAGLGVAAGNLINKGLNAAGNNIMEGTDTQIKYQETTANEERDDALVSMLGNFAGQAAGAIGSSAASSVGNKGILSKFLGKGKNSNGVNYANQISGILNGLSNDVNVGNNRLNEDLFQVNPEYQQEEINSQVTPKQDQNSNIIWLDDNKKKTNLTSTLPNNMYGFANGGEILPFYKLFRDGGAIDRRGAYYKEGDLKIYTNDVRDIQPDEPQPVASESTSVATPTISIKDRIAMAEGSWNKKNPYAEKNNVGNGHFGKYQMEPRLISQFAPGLTIQQFLESPQAQESAMDRLLAAYQPEVEQIRKKTGTDWDTDSLILLNHFQGYNNSIKALQNPEILTKATKNNPSIMDYITKRSFGVFANGGVPGLSFQVKDKHFNFNTEDIPFKVYDDDDKTEDFYMVPKDAVEEVGLTDVMNILKLGEARYGERVFRQKSNLIQKAIMHSDAPEEEKKSLLGEHIFGELQLHSDFGGPSNIQYFADGGEVKKLKSFLSDRIATLRKEIEVQSRKVQKISTKNKNGEVNSSEGFGGAVNRLFGQNPTIENQDLSKLTTEFSRLNRTVDAIDKGEIQYTDKGFVNSRGQVIANNASSFTGDPQYYADRFVQLESSPAPVATTVPKSTAAPASSARPAVNPAPAVASQPAVNIPNPNNPPARQGSGSGVSSPRMPGSPASTTPKNNTATSISTPANQRDKVRDFQMNYNFWAKANGQPVIAADGIYGDKTQRAIQNWNMNHPAWDNISLSVGKTIDPNTGKETVNLVGLDNPKDPELIEDVNPELRTGNPLSKTFGNIQNALATGQTSATNPVAETEAPAQKMTPGQRQNLFGNLTDIARAGIGALTSYMNPIPKYELPAEYTQMSNDINSRRNQGFEANEMASINQNLQNNYATTVSSIKSAVGGGASQGAVLAALGQAGAGLNRGYLDASIADNAQRRQNYGNYQQNVLRGLQLDQQMFEQDRNVAIAQRQSGMQLMDSALKNINDRRYDNMTYGEGSQYSLLLEEMKNGTAQAKDMSARLPELWLKRIQSQIK